MSPGLLFIPNQFVPAEGRREAALFLFCTGEGLGNESGEKNILRTWNKGGTNLLDEIES
jgi:hypothetical protein